MLSTTYAPTAALLDLAPPVAAESFSTIERLPGWLLWAPMVAQWLWLGVRHGSLTLPSAVNPDIETGGLAGETKLGTLTGFPDEVQRFVARTAAIRPGDAAVEVRLASNIAYPLIAKPDIGWCGHGVRLVRGDDDLIAYQAAFPSNAVFLLQAYAPGPGEAGLLYVRSPGSPRGRLSGIALRHSLHVVGDGHTPVADLIAASPRATRSRFLPAALLREKRVPARGEIVTLMNVASVRVGSRYEDASTRITQALEARVEALAAGLGRFHFGRFDVRFATLSELLAGEFTVIEVNGAGAQPIQFWDSRYSLVEAFAGVFAKQRLLFDMGAQMRAAGGRPVGTIGLLRAFYRQWKLLAQYPACN